MTLREIEGQYRALTLTVDYILSRQDDIRETIDLEQTDRVIFTGSGSGYSLSRSAAMSVGIRLHLHGLAMAAGDLMLNAKRYTGLFDKAILITPSRSGNTSEVVESVKLAKKHGVPTVGIVAQANSNVEPLVDLCLVMPWAFDQSVCQTRTVTNLYVANLMLIGVLARDTTLLDEIKRAVAAGPNHIATYRDTMIDVARQRWSRAVVLADGELEGIASEGSLAFAEICQLPSEYHHVLDVRHGPMVLIGPDTLAIMVTSDQDSKLQKRLITDLNAKGAKTLTVGSVGQDWGAKWHVQTEQYTQHGVLGIPFIYVPQAISLYKALERGINPDQPEGLDPWIDLEKTS